MESLNGICLKRRIRCLLAKVTLSNPGTPGAPGHTEPERHPMTPRRVALVAGGRTPFIKSGKAFADVDSLAMAVHATRGMLDRSGIDPELIESVVFGTMTPDPLKPNLARELVFEAGLPIRAEAHTVASYCITGLRAVTVVADAIAGGRVEVGLAGGVDSLTRASMDLFREPSTGLTMGEHMELTCKEWDIPRERQDEVALASHRNAVAARDKLAGEIHPLLGEEADSGPRADTSLEALAALKPVFDPENGTLTAGNSSPVTDGAAAVLLMSEEKAAECGLEPLAYIGGMAYAAHDPSEGLLMAPAISVPRLLGGRNLSMADMDLVEIPRGLRGPGPGQRGSVGTGLEGRADGPGGLGPRERQRQLHRRGPSLGGHGHAHHHDPGPRDGAARRPLRPGQHLRRGGHGGRVPAGAVGSRDRPFPH